MKYSAAILALVAVASAQSLNDFPTCAKKCLDDAIHKDTPCDTTDVACICKNFAAVQGDSTGCVIAACGADVAINTVLPLAESLCPTGGAGPAASAPPTSAAAPPTSAAAPPPTSAPAPPPTSAAAAPPTSAPASSAPPTSAAAPPTSAPASSAPPASSAHGSSSTLKSVPAGTGSVNGTVPTGGPHVNGASGLASVGGLAMLALGALAL